MDAERGLLSLSISYFGCNSTNKLLVSELSRCWEGDWALIGLWLYIYPKKQERYNSAHLTLVNKVHTSILPKQSQAFVSSSSFTNETVCGKSWFSWKEEGNDVAEEDVNHRFKDRKWLDMDRQTTLSLWRWQPRHMNACVTFFGCTAFCEAHPLTLCLRTLFSTDRLIFQSSVFILQVFIFSTHILQWGFSAREEIQPADCFDIVGPSPGKPLCSATKGVLHLEPSAAWETPHLITAVKLFEELQISLVCVCVCLKLKRLNPKGDFRHLNTTWR